MKKSRKIMLIDDDPGIVEVTSLVLAEKGYEVATIAQNDNIQECIKKNLPDLIVLDLWIFHHNGQQILQEMRQDPVVKDIPVILMSANNELGQIAQKIRANGYIPKPFDINELIEKIKSLLS
jgi:DNA-binding response OmpR family regulator